MKPETHSDSCMEICLTHKILFMWAQHFSPNYKVPLMSNASASQCHCYVWCSVVKIGIWTFCSTWLIVMSCILFFSGQSEPTNIWLGCFLWELSSFFIRRLPCPSQMQYSDARPPLVVTPSSHTLVSYSAFWVPPPLYSDWCWPPGKPSFTLETHCRKTRKYTQTLHNKM